LRRIWKRGRRSRSADGPVYFSTIKHLTADEWRSAFAENPEKAARWVYAGATYGSIQAQLVWAQMLLDGHGTKRDRDAAFRWFSIAAKSKRADAVNMLGRCYERGWGVSMDYEKAAACYAEAADQSYDWARFNLACLLLEGKGVARDPGRAFTLFMKGVRQGHVKSLNMVGHCYEHGLGCERSMAKALDWYRQSAQAGDFRGQYRYGQLLYEGGMVREAVSWLHLAVGSAPAEFGRYFIAELLNHPDPRLQDVGIGTQAHVHLVDHERSSSESTRSAAPSISSY
jgi:TPR repeat protein